MFSFTTLLRRAAALTTAATMVAMAACSDKAAAPVDPVLPGNPPIPAQYRGAAFLMDVSALRKTVRITAPNATIAAPLANLSLGVHSGPQYSLLGGDVIDLSTSNFQAGAVGASVPGKVLITFDLTINNRLSGIRLITPTFPTPPSGVTGVQAFPFEITVTTTSGGVTGSGNEVIVQSPRFGAVVPSDNWNGNFHNFFNDAACAVTDNDCFRYESFGPIEPLGSSSTQQVGFLIDPTVGDFRVKVILAADLENGVAPTPGSVSGTVTSPQLGNISGATVNVSGGFSGTTAASGAYSISGVATGSRTVSVTNLPSGCVAPASQNITVATGAASTVNFVVTCTVPTGSISGTITSSLGGGLVGVGVIATPTGGAATPTVNTTAGGAYTIANVPALSATGAITLTNLPSNCTAPAPLSYSGFTTAGLTGQNIVVTCTPPPASYPVSLEYGPITNTGPTGRQVQIRVRWNVGALEAVGLEFGIGFNGTQLAFASRQFTSTFDFGAQSVSGAGTAAAVLSAGYGAVSPAFETGSFQVVAFTFNIATGFSGSITPTLTISGATRNGGAAIPLAQVPVTPPAAIVVP
jgi:hypothetical protein